MDDLELVNEIVSMLEMADQEGPSFSATNHALTNLIKKIDRQIRLIEAEEIGLTLV